MVFSIDSGTTNSKVFLFDNDGRLVRMASQPTPTFYPQAGWVEQPAEGWWQAVVQATKNLGIGPKKKRLSGLSLSSQGGTFVLLDREMKPLRPAITWLDNRARAIAACLNRQYGQDFFYQKTGHVLRGWAPLALLLWLKRVEQETWKHIHRVSFVSDYLNFKLTGRFYLDHTSAQMSCLYNLRTGTWDEELLQLTGLKPEQLPEILPADAIGGETRPPECHQLDLPAGLPGVAGGHDQYCACLGTGAGKKGDILLSCGTAWALLLTTDRLIFDNEHLFCPGRHILKGKYGLMGVVSEAGALLAWIRENMKINLAASLSEKIEKKIAGLRVKLGFTQGKGAISNLSLSVTGQEIYVKVLQTLIGEVCWLLKHMEEKTKINRIYLAGGGTKEPLLPNYLEEFTGKKVVVPEVKEAAGRGAAFLVSRTFREKAGRKNEKLGRD
ncbi:MAG: FGGY family carbohydrate kinase [Candidatus Omnitrophica bacterium]|nr:FGGY family carbohydrate kinase [Candidatus Omnitrophota bacterium]